MYTRVFEVYVPPRAGGCWWLLHLHYAVIYMPRVACVEECTAVVTAGGVASLVDSGVSSG